MLVYFDLKMADIMENIENPSEQTIFSVLKENALFCCQTQAFCSMKIIVQFTSSPPANGFLLLYYTAAMKMKLLMLVCPIPPPCFQCPCEPNINPPTEMPTTFENHEKIFGVRKVNCTVILNAQYEHITFVLVEKDSILPCCTANIVCSEVTLLPSSKIYLQFMILFKLPASHDRYTIC